MKNVYRSRVYTERPDYANFDPPNKFMAIQSIIAKRLREHPNAICSYSGGSDSDIMIDMIERTREIFNLPSVKYVFFNTGLEMKATRDHVARTSKKYGVEIEECRPKVNIINAVRRNGVPFVSKIMSSGLSEWQRKGIPLSIAEEYEQASDKGAKRKELKELRAYKEKMEMQYLDDISNPLEPLKLQSALKSEIFKYNYRKEHKPQDINILDYTIMYALKHCLEEKLKAGEEDV